MTTSKDEDSLPSKGDALGSSPADVTRRMLHAGKCGDFERVIWLVEKRGADIGAQDASGLSMWTFMTRWLKWDVDVDDVENRVGTCLLKIMLLDSPAPQEFHNTLSFLQQAGLPATTCSQRSKDYQSLLADGARLRHRLPYYHANTLDCIKEVCPVPNDIHDIIFEYQMLATSEEIWATGLGSALTYRFWAAPRTSQRHKREREEVEFQMENNT
jgi:hypothetical protein